MGKIRIIGGVNRGRMIDFADNIDGLRPTLDRIRETLFNWLGQDLTGKKVLDLFAGSGAIGFEASSRGAKCVTMIEKNISATKNLRLNQSLLQCENITIFNGDGVAYLLNCKCDFDVLFLDPPYQGNLLYKCLKIIENRYKEMQNILIYIEFEKTNNPDLAKYNVIKEKRTSTLRYMLLKLK